MSLASEVRAGRAYVEIIAKDKELQSGLKRAQVRLQNFIVSVRSISNDLFAFDIAKNQITQLMRNFVDFDDKFKTLQAVTGANDVQMRKLAESLDTMAAELGFAKVEIVQAQIELAKLGFGITEITQSAPAVLKLLRAVGAQSYRLGEAAETTAAILKDFNLSADHTARVCDILAYAANQSAVDIFDLGQSLRTVGPLAYQVGDDLEAVTAQLMVLSNAGIKGELAGTALRRVYQSIAEQSGEAATQLREMGISVVDTNGDLRSAIDIMSDLSRVVNEMRTGKKINFTVDVFDIRGTLGALPLFSAMDDVAVFEQALRNSGGTVDMAAMKIESGLGGALRRLRGELDVILKSIGEYFAPLIQGITNLISLAIKATQKFEFFTTVIGRTFATVGGGLFVLGGLLKAFSFLADVIGSVRQALSAVGKGIKSFFAVSQVRQETLSRQEISKNEQAKALMKERADAVRMASEKRRHMQEIANAKKEAQTVLISEKQKLKAAKETNPNSAQTKKLELSVQTSTEKVKRLSREYDRAAAEMKQFATAAATANASLVKLNTSQRGANRNYGIAAAQLAKMNILKATLSTTTKRYRTIIMATSTTELLAAKRAMGASKGRLILYAAELIAIKGIGAAWGSLSKAILNSPVAIVLAAATAIVVAGNAYRDQQKELRKTILATKRSAVDSQREITNSKTQERDAIFQTLDTLKEYNRALNSQEQTQAITIIGGLTQQFGDLGLRIDEATGKLLGFEEAQKKITEVTTQGLIDSITTEQELITQSLDVMINGLEGKLGNVGKRATLGAGIRELTNVGDDQLAIRAMDLKQRMLNQEFSLGIQDEDLMNEEMIELIDEAVSLIQQAHENQRRLTDATFQQIKNNATQLNQYLSEIGVNASNFLNNLNDFSQSIAESYSEISQGNEYQQKFSAAEQLAADMSKRESEYTAFYESEKAALRATLANLQRELLRTFDADLQGKIETEISIIENSLMNLDKDFEAFSVTLSQAREVMTTWYAEAERMLRENHSKWTDFLNQRSMEQAQAEREKADNAFLETVKASGNFRDAYKQFVVRMEDLVYSLAQAEENYRKSFAAATNQFSAGGQIITETEGEDLQRLQEQISLLDEEREYLLGLGNQIKEMANAVQNNVLGSFSAQALDLMSGGVSSPEERTARATEDTARGIKNLERTFRKMENMYILGY